MLGSATVRNYWGGARSAMDTNERDRYRHLRIGRGSDRASINGVAMPLQKVMTKYSRGVFSRFALADNPPGTILVFVSNGAGFSPVATPILLKLLCSPADSTVGSKKC